MTTGIRMNLYVQPRAERSEIAGWHGAELKIRVAASPIDNAANEELIAFMAKKLRIPKRNIRLVRGFGSRHKILEVSGASAVALAALHTGARLGETALAARAPAAPRTQEG